ncbi:MAG TPA: hypothetical protein VF168_14410 [Trueperaceae bacterium]
MNLEMIARLNQDHLQQLRSEATRDAATRADLRLPQVNGASSIRQTIRCLFTPACSRCCQAVS